MCYSFRHRQLQAMKLARDAALTADGFYGFSHSHMGEIAEAFFVGIESAAFKRATELCDS